MTVADNIEARNNLTAALTGGARPPMTAAQAYDALFGWVYKRPGMPTLDDCRDILLRVRADRGQADADILLQRFGLSSITDLWMGRFDDFFTYARTCLYFGVSPNLAWRTREEVDNKMRDRWLLWHPESKCLYEVRGEVPRELVGGEVSDVSGVEQYERMFADHLSATFGSSANEEQL